jgi:CRISPR-associated protein Cas2
VFVAVACEMASDDHRVDVHRLLSQYGFKQVQRDLFESTTLRSTSLARLKRDVDRRTDSYDRIRIYQYPIEGTLVMTTLADKKWRRTIVKADPEDT